jgi:hypothetical protein
VLHGATRRFISAQADASFKTSPSCLEKHRKMCYNKTKKGGGDMKNKNEKVNDYMNKYSDHHCILIKKYRTLFHYVWVLEEQGQKFKVHVGKALYFRIQNGTQLTIGKIGRKLINIRPGFCKTDK